jgi:ATP-binding cassette subfamily B protein
MMSEGRSVLLNRQLPKDLADLLLRQGVNPGLAWLCTDTDLNLSGSYEQVFLLVEADRLLTVGRPSPQCPKPVRIELTRRDISEIRTRQGIGGGFMDARVEGVFVEILAYSNASADTFHKVASKLKKWLAGEPVEISPEDDYDPRKCPKCGLSLEHKGEICRRCVDRGKVLSRVVALMKPYRGWAALMLIVLFVVIGLQMVPPRLTEILVDKVLNPATRPPVPHDTLTLWLIYLGMAIFAVYVLTAIGNGINGRLSSYVGTEVTNGLRNALFKKLTQLSVDYYDRHSVGHLISRMGNDTEAMRDFVRQATQGFLAQILTVIVTGAMLFSISWKLALWTLLPAPLVVIASIFYWKRVYPRYFRVWDSGSRMMGAFGSVLSGIRVVKAFGQEPHEETRFARSSSYVRDSQRRVEYATSIFNPAMGFIFSLGSLIVWYVGGRDVIAEQGFTLGKLMAFFGYLGMFYAPLTQMTQLSDWSTRFLTAAQRTFEILDTSPQIMPSEKPKRLTSPQGAVSFRNVMFGYSRHEPVIKNVSLEIKPAERIGIVGKSGSGKTTLINLLARFYDVDEGVVLVDGVDVRDLDAHDLNRVVGIVLQEPFLFRGTIYENITYGRHDATPDQVLAAAKAANAHDFIIRHSLGYDTYIGERGAGLSGGERQRISIARALLYDPKILVLDEATSNVDTESEQLIQEALARVTRGRTTIAIAHRLSTLKNSDRVIVVDEGRIIEQGTHEQLLALGGMYYRLVKIQTELSREPSVDAVVATGKK